MPNINRIEEGPSLNREDRTIDQPLLTARDWRLIGDAFGLSMREVQVSQHIMEGKHLSETAAELGLGLGTIKTYVQRIYRKLEISNQRELAMKIMSAHMRLST